MRLVGLVGLFVFAWPALPHSPLPPSLSHSPSVAAQEPDRASVEAQASRVSQRILALQREADRLAGEARTLLGDLRQLEIERDLEIERVNVAQAAVSDAQIAVRRTTERLEELEQQRVSQLPDLETQLVDMYKQGRARYARLLFGATDLREFGRAMRAVTAMVRINEQRIAEHQRTLEALQVQRATLEDELLQLQASQAEASRARAAAEAAVAARTALIAQIDTQRDLNAQLAGELQVAYENLQQQMAALGSGQFAEAVDVPLAPFRGVLDWPVAGDVTGQFGEPSSRFGGVTVRNGIEVAAVEGTPVRAMHSGTVSYADAFTGFGNLVIVDHGANNYSLYGYLASTSVGVGDSVDTGTEVGRVGSAPAGPPALYFEIRIDGRSVDPVEWLRAR